MERIFFDRIVKLLVTCPHFRGLDIYIDSVKELEIYSAPYILGILPRDWDRIRNKTSLFDSAGRISRTHWEKIVNSTTESKSTNMRYKIIIATGKTNYKGNQNLLWSSLPTITLVIVLAIVIAIAITIVIVAVVAAALVIIIIIIIIIIIVVVVVVVVAIIS